jgi:tetratricopeptide (TPR) repeat protein
MGDVQEALRQAGYDVTSELGRGGMGVVFRARQVRLDRWVAVKVIRSVGGPTESDLRRFQTEALAVARLDHPHIVPIYEIGHSLGHDYFSMKLIAGQSLDRKLGDYIEAPSVAARLVEVAAEAVHHAHMRGILHRDIKPANILIDDTGKPHVTDFGLAYHMDGAAERSRSGALVGTPAYMSPEQAGGLKDALTTASDVYGLGAVLYALLTGRAPFSGGNLYETLDLVRSVPPEPPSRRNARVPRDLEVICLKCLEKDPARRYPDARSLAEDLGRWLSGRPIAARPVAATTRLWLWCRRHPVPATLSAALAASILCGVGLVGWKGLEAERKERKASKVVAFLSDRVLRQASTEVNPRAANPSLREVLDRASARVGGDFQAEPEVEAAIRETLGSTYASLGELIQAEPHLREALRLDTRLLGPTHASTLHVANELAALLDALGQPAEAESQLRANRTLARKALGPDAPATLEADDRLGSLLRRLGRRDEAEPILRSTLAARRRLLPTDDPETLRSVRELCLLAADRGELAEAESLAVEYEHGIRCAFGPKHPDNVAALSNRGFIRLLRGHPVEAEPYYRQAAEEALRILGPDHAATLNARSEHARVLLQATATGDHLGNQR